MHPAFSPLVAGSGQLLSGTSTAGYIKIWTGAAFELKPVKVWTGASWEIKPVKYYDGATWVTT